MAKTQIATLEQGNTYFLADKRFDKGIPVEVTTEEAKILKGAKVSKTFLGDDGVAETQEQARFKFGSSGSTTTKTSGSRGRNKSSEDSDEPEDSENSDK